jgi:predicted GIY-YIG superfamily endonuclease
LFEDQPPSGAACPNTASGKDASIEMDFQPAVYILTNQRNGTLYGVTSNLPKRNWEHCEHSFARIRRHARL